MNIIKNYQELEELCQIIKPISQIVEIPENDGKEKIVKAILDDLKRQKLQPEDAMPLSGIKGYDLHQNTLILYEKPSLYPSQDNKDNHSSFLSAMTGVFTHCIDPENKLYAMQMRGKNLSGAGKIQTAAAGFGEFNEPLHKTALRELKEEMSLEGKLIMHPNVFLDATPFTVNGYPQILLSYITQADLSKLPELANVDELRQRRGMLEEGEVSYAFSVSIKKLDQFAKDIEKVMGFHGPVEKTLKSFIDWYSSNNYYK